jgi:hypothetical protein
MMPVLRLEFVVMVPSASEPHQFDRIRFAGTRSTGLRGRPEQLVMPSAAPPAARELVGGRGLGWKPRRDHAVRDQRSDAAPTATIGCMPPGLSRYREPHDHCGFEPVRGVAGAGVAAGDDADGDS